jgi:UDP-N-acetylmuramoylalanine--D-glutamate ligase
MRNKKIGIWGFGVVGKSALLYLSAKGNQCVVLDKRDLTDEDRQLLRKYNATYIPEEQLEYFFSHNDYILASPGIDINPYKHRAHFICELDIFAPAWHKPLIAITGTVGKTSTTTLLGNLLQQTMRVAVGGNIGTPMLSFLDQQNNFDCAVLELSSWQLEHAQPFAPDIAVWTNFSPNHLDRHQTMQAYFDAKCQILSHQTAEQTSILPISLFNQIAPLNLASQKIWIDDTGKTFTPELTSHYQWLYVEDNSVVITNAHDKILLCDINALPHCTYRQNMLSAAAVLHTLHMPFDMLKDTDITFEHRLEKVACKNNITYYNDSKATVPESTLAALAEFKDKKVILFLGGLSKGVDRAEFIRTLPTHIKEVICFGKEAEQLNALCTDHNINSSVFYTLEPAFAHAIKIAQSENIILFSPAGSSFDLYADYAERGRHFKQLVHEYTNN